MNRIITTSLLAMAVLSGCAHVDSNTTNIDIAFSGNTSLWARIIYTGSKSPIQLSFSDRSEPQSSCTNCQVVLTVVDGGVTTLQFDGQYLDFISQGDVDVLVNGQKSSLISEIRELSKRDDRFRIRESEPGL